LWDSENAGSNRSESRRVSGGVLIGFSLTRAPRNGLPRVEDCQVHGDVEANLEHDWVAGEAEGQAADMAAEGSLHLAVHVVRVGCANNSLEESVQVQTRGDHCQEVEALVAREQGKEQDEHGLVSNLLVEVLAYPLHQLIVVVDQSLVGLTGPLCKC
jgi:hypothetical protein